MRRVLAIAFALALFAMVGTGAALANHKDNDNACPPNSPAGSQDSEATPPCGQGQGQGPGNGNGNGNGNGDAEQCDQADLVVLRGPELVCVYLGENTENAEADCNGTIEVPIPGVVVACILPTDAEGAPTPGAGELPALPGL